MTSTWSRYASASRPNNCRRPLPAPLHVTIGLRRGDVLGFVTIGLRRGDTPGFVTIGLRRGDTPGFYRPRLSCGHN